MINLNTPSKRMMDEILSTSFKKNSHLGKPWFFLNFFSLFSNFRKNGMLNAKITFKGKVSLLYKATVMRDS